MLRRSAITQVIASRAYVCDVRTRTHATPSCMLLHIRPHSRLDESMNRPDALYQTTKLMRATYKQHACSTHAARMQHARCIHSGCMRSHAAWRMHRASAHKHAHSTYPNMPPEMPNACLMHSKCRRMNQYETCSVQHGTWIMEPLPSTESNTHPICTHHAPKRHVRTDISMPRTMYPGRRINDLHDPRIHTHARAYVFAHAAQPRA